MLLLCAVIASLAPSQESSIGTNANVGAVIVLLDIFDIAITQGLVSDEVCAKCLVVTHLKVFLTFLTPSKEFFFNFAHGA